MAVGRTQIRLGALTGSLVATGAKVAAGGLDVDSLQGSLDALAAAMQRQIGAVPANSWYSLDTDVLSIATAAVVSGSLSMKNGSGVEKAKLTNLGYMSGSGIRIGSLGGADATVFSEVNADLSIGPGPQTAWTNRHIILDGGTAGTTGGVRAVVQAGGGKFSIAASGAPTTAVAHIDNAGAVSGSSFAAGGVLVGDSWGTVLGAYLADSAGHRRLEFVNGASLKIKNDAGAANVMEVSDTVVTVTGDITGSKGLRLTGAVGDRVLHVDAGNAQFDNNVDVTGNVTITGNLDVNGTTTTIDTEQLSIQDSVIAMGMSGSGIPGPAGDRGLFMCLQGANDPALVWSNATGGGRFALAKTATSPSASMGTIALSSNADLQLGKLYVLGDTIDLNVATNMDLLDDAAAALSYRFGTDTMAKWISTNANPALQLQDTVALNFGDSADGLIKFAGTDFSMLGAALTDIKIGVVSGQDVKVQVNSADALAIGGAVLKTDSTRFVGPTAGSFILSSSATRDIELYANGAEIELYDGNKVGSTWTSANGIKLSETAAEWSDYETNFGEVSLMAAIVQAKGSALGASKTQMAISGSVSSIDLSATAGGRTTNMTGTTPASRQKGCNVFVNGQLMHSGTEAQRSAATADYNMVDSAPAAVDFKFAFTIQPDDIVTVTVN